MTNHLCALRFFYIQTLKRPWSIADTPYPKKVHGLPTILSQEEVAQLVDAACTPFHRTIPASSSPASDRLFNTTHFICLANWHYSLNPRSLPPGSGLYFARTGSSTPNHLSGALSMCSSISPAVWLMAGCFDYLALSFSGFLFPQYEDKVFTYTQPLLMAEVAIMLWLMIMGAKPPAGGRHNLVGFGC
jgi:hypothetical protein